MLIFDQYLCGLDLGDIWHIKILARKLDKPIRSHPWSQRQQHMVPPSIRQS